MGPYFHFSGNFFRINPSGDPWQSVFILFGIVIHSGTIIRIDNLAGTIIDGYPYFLSQFFLPGTILSPFLKSKVPNSRYSYFRFPDQLILEQFYIKTIYFGTILPHSKITNRIKSYSSSMKSLLETNPVSS